MKQIAKLKDDARRYELREEWDQAIDAYLQVLRLTDDGDMSEMDLPIYNRVGDLYVRLGKPMEAVKYYEQAADRYADAGLYNNAIALCNKALRYEPGRLPVLKKLGAFSASQGFFTDARRWYLEFAEKSLKRNAVDDAFSALSDLADISEDPEIRELLARQLREYGRDVEAIQEFKRLHAMRVASGEQEEADAIAAELRQIDPAVDLTAAAAPITHHTPEWQHTDQLPGFLDIEPAPPETVAEPEPEPEKEPEPEVEPAMSSSAESEMMAEPELEAQLDFEPAAEAEADFEMPSNDSDEPRLESDELPLLMDLDEVSFDDLAPAETTASSVEDDANVDEPLDFEPLEIEVEEERSFIDISSLRMMPQSRVTPEEQLDSAVDFADLDIEFEEQEIELPALDLTETSEEEEPQEYEIIEGLEQYEAELPLLPTFGAPESGSIASFDEAEFGDYIAPPPRVFDFDDEEEEAEAEEEEKVEELPPLDELDALEAADDVIAEHNEIVEAAADVTEDDYIAAAAEFELANDDDAAGDLEFDAAFDADSFLETSFASNEESDVAFVEEPAFEIDEPVEEPAVELDEAVEEPAFEIEAAAVEPAFEIEAELEAEVDSEVEAELEEDIVAEIGTPVEHAEIEEVVEPIEEHSFADEMIAPEPPGHAEPGAPVFEPMPEPVFQAPPPPAAPMAPARAPAGDYIDLAALFGEEEKDQAEESTRFVVAEMPPTGDEEKDFADMLQQFKEKVAQSIPKEDAGSHYDLGIAFKEMGLIDEAISEFQTALRSGQDRLKVYEELGTCFLLKQQYSIAITVLNRAQQMPHGDDTELLGVYYNLGRAHEELGQKAEARAAFEKIVAVDISFQDTTKRLARL